MSKRRQTLKCPVCKIEVKASRLDIHMQKVHPETATRPRSAGKPAPRSLAPAIFAAVAVVAVLVVAGVGIYYLNLPEPEENGTRYTFRYARFIDDTVKISALTGFRAYPKAITGTHAGSA